MINLKTLQILLTVIILLNTSDSNSTPLNGTYTIGNGGTYSTITSAIEDAQNQGIDGPVIFNISTGVYEGVSIPQIPGASSVNTIVIKSNTGNSSDVIVNGFSISSSYISIMNLSINSGITIYSGYISIINIDFQNSNLSLFSSFGFPAYAHNINILNNINIYKIFCWGEYRFGVFLVDSVQIKNNSINTKIECNTFCSNFVIENNTISGGIQGGDNTFSTIKNQINGEVRSGSYLINNFIYGKLFTTGQTINNTIIGGSIDTPTVTNYNNTIFLNNIIVNLAGGATIDFQSLSGSDYNVFYNGGGSGLIKNQGNTYNSVQDFYNATGSDQHSGSQPVFFQSPTDLHLAGSSIGDSLLIGIHDILVPDDIDGDYRNTPYPYRGADEADIPLNKKQLDLTILTQGLYIANSNTMIEDTVRICIRNSFTPYSIVDSAVSKIDSLGQGTFSFINIFNGIGYYIHIKHRNSIETWSKTPQQFLANTLIYDFSTAKTKAYGNNLILVDSSPFRYGIYSGDVNQDGNVDISDGSLIDNDMFNFAFGYLLTDVNGDEVIDLEDAVFVDNNGFNFVEKFTP